MTDQIIDPKTIDRIRKLLALANGGTTEAEAEAAMSKAQAIMAEHNLTMAALERSGGQGEGRRKESTKTNLMYPWKRELLGTIARVNFCYINIEWKITKSNQCIGAGFSLIGRESNIVAARNMWEYLLDTIEKLVVAEVGTSPQERYTRWSHSFRLGAATRLRERLNERYETIIREQERKVREEQARAKHPSAVSTNNALVVLREYASSEEDLNNDFAYGLEPGTTAARRAKRNAKWAAYQELLRSQPPRPAVVEEPRPETAKERRAREANERASARYWEAQRRRRERENAKIDWSAHDAGRSRANDVGLDTQVDRRETRKLGG